MAWPLTPYESVSAGVTVKAALLTAIQEAINGAYGATYSFKGLVIDGTGGAVVVGVARQLSCTGGQLDIVGYHADGVRVTQAALSSGSPTALTVKSAQHNSLSTAEAVQCLIDLSQTQQFTTGGGTIATQRGMRIRAPAYSATAATLTFTTAATLEIEGAPSAGTNAAISNPYALLITAGNLRLANGGISLTGSIVAGVDITALSAVIAGTTVTGGTGVAATTGNVQATAGNVIAAGTPSGDAGPGLLKGKRLYSTGTAIAVADVDLSAGWNTGGTDPSSVTGDDVAGTAVWTNGGAPGANPTVTVNFKDGTWTTAPTAMCFLMNDTLGGAWLPIKWTTTATTIDITYDGTPPAGMVHRLVWMVIGR